MKDKSKFFLFIAFESVLIVLLLISCFAIKVNADDIYQNDDEFKSLRNIRVDYGYTLYDSDYSSNLSYIYPESYLDSTIRILFDDGYYIELFYVEDLSKSVSYNDLSFMSFGSFITNCIPSYYNNGYKYCYYNENNSDNIFNIDGSIVICFDVSGVSLIKTDTYEVRYLSNYIRFSVLGYDGNDFYFGCLDSDFQTQLSISSLYNYYFVGDSVTSTNNLCDWFFNVCYPIFGHSMTTEIDLGIFGSYQPIYLYKFIFCLSLVLVGIIVLVWLPLYWILRLLRVRRHRHK